MPPVKLDVLLLPDLREIDGRVWFKLKRDDKMKWQPDKWRDPARDEDVQTVFGAQDLGSFADRAKQAAPGQFAVKRIGLFGSYASGRHKPSSDIDFLVEFEHPTYDNFIGLIGHLERTFRRKVEVLTPDAVASIRVREVAQSIRDSVVYV